MIEKPRCFERGCKHFTGVKADVPGTEKNERPTCAAFPNGIPDAIAYGANLHLSPFPGDHGIRFEAEA